MLSVVLIVLFIREVVKEEGVDVIEHADDFGVVVFRREDLVDEDGAVLGGNEQQLVILNQSNAPCRLDPVAVDLGDFIVHRVLCLVGLVPQDSLVVS